MSQINNENPDNQGVKEKMSLLGVMSNTSSTGLDNIIDFLKKLTKDTFDEIGQFLSDNKKAIFLQFAFAGAFTVIFMFLNVGFLYSALIGITGLMVYWAILLKNFFAKKLFGNISTAEIVIYTVFAVFGLYNPFHFDILHLGKHIYDLGELGVNLYTVKVGIPFGLLLYFWYYASRYTFETSYESLGGWKASGLILFYVSILLLVGVVIGLDNVAFYVKPLIFTAQAFLAYIVYESFGFAKRHYSRSKTVTTNAKEGDEINTASVDDENIINEAEDDITTH